MHAAVAQRRTRVAQLWVGVLLAACIGMLLIPTSWLRSDPVVDGAKSMSKPVFRAAAIPTSPLPTAEMALALNRISPKQKDAEKPIVVMNPEEPEVVQPLPPPPPPPSAVRLITSIIGAAVDVGGVDRRRAVVAVNDVQKIASPGDYISGEEGRPGAIKLISVEAGKIVVERDGHQEDVTIVIPKDRPLTIMPSGNPNIAAAAKGTVPPPGQPNQPGHEDPAMKARRDKERQKIEMERGKGKGREPQVDREGDR